MPLIFEPWAGGLPIQQQLEQATMWAQRPDTIMGWIFWALDRIGVENSLLTVVALTVGLAAAVGATEIAKRFQRLFMGPNWALKAQLCAALWGTIVTTALIIALTDWPLTGRLVAVLAIAPMAAFWPHRAYDLAREYFPQTSERVLGKLRGDKNIDASPP